MALLLAWNAAVQLSLMHPLTPPDANAGPAENALDDQHAGQPEEQSTPSPHSAPQDPQRPEQRPQPAGEIPVIPSSTGQPQADLLKTVPSPTYAPADEGRPGASEEEKNFFDALHGGVSHGFLATAGWLDSFFGDERYEAEIGKSQLKIRFDAFREGGTGMDYRRPNFDLRLVLPQLDRKTHLVISGDARVDVEATTVPPAGGSAQPAKGTERNLVTALQYFPVETIRSNFSIRAGVKLRNGKLEMLAGPRYRYLIPLDPWALRFTQELLWSSDMRWQSRTTFDFERTLTADLFFRMSLQGIWSENVAGYPYALSFLLRQPLDNNRAIQYEWVNSFQTRPTNELDEELLILRYRQRFLREWLFLELAPQYRFARTGSFEATPGILFRLEMVFGDIRGIF
jgi:hypothetical protein